MSEGLSRLEYLRLLRLGYIRNMHSDGMPVDLWEELAVLEEIEAARLAEIAEAEAQKRALIEAERRARFDLRNTSEGRLEEHWQQQRQLGKTEASQRWAERYGVELPVIMEMAETEEEMMEAIRKLKNVQEAKRSQGLGRRKKK